ncbi:hypothetical protein GCM10009549_25180 [Streptomyces thermoalcalitolerans]|uniref:Uncharacterized protein n=1 Tax=Streptomyces thermoalcalitolerans TaxID=65605 RepID=A0ABN1NNC3_9ACTN
MGGSGQQQPGPRAPQGGHDGQQYTHARTLVPAHPAGHEPVDPMRVLLPHGYGRLTGHTARWDTVRQKGDGPAWDGAGVTGGAG